METVYFALYDTQTKRYLQSGINSTSLNDLFEAFVSYILPESNHSKDYFLKKFKNNPEHFFSNFDFVLETSKDKFPEEDDF